MKKTVVVHIYNFIRMSHTEPSSFIQDDFDTIRNQLILVKQYGFPGTYALKYDALMNPQYQELLKEYLDENDEVGAWWEITEPMCRKAGVRFHDTRQEIEYDDRVDSAYSLGYEPEDRKRLVDVYMEDFYSVFGRYPGSIGSWVIDSVTLGYAREKYGVRAACICRDQIGVDGFTLWGGWPNGVYFPSKYNAYLPASTKENQMDIPVFRLLGPDPIYNFEANARHFLHGVCTLEPAWKPGRNPHFINWIFSGLTDEDVLGIGYAQVGQENNFLWENIRPGFDPQLAILERLLKEGKIRIETMSATAKWFSEQYELTPPLSYQASSDWTDGGLTAQWYAGVNYRFGLLGEDGKLRIRDLFIYREDYPCRYLNHRMKERKSTFDALPVLYPQPWGGAEDRPFIRLLDAAGAEPEGQIVYDALDDKNARARLLDGETCLAKFVMDQGGMTLEGGYRLHFDKLPVLKEVKGREICMEHEGYCYSMSVEKGNILFDAEGRLEIEPKEGVIRLVFGADPGEVKREKEVPFPVPRRSSSRPIPPMTPVAEPEDSVFAWGDTGCVELSSHDEGIIRYTLDGSEPDENAAMYEAPIVITDDTVVKACLFTSDGKVSETGSWAYYFGKKDIRLESPTRLDPRPVFCGNGFNDLLSSKRASTDYLDGRWLGSLDDMDILGEMEPEMVESIRIGFISHHRSGVIYPETVELYVGPDRDHLRLAQVFDMPHGPGKREIEKMDAVFSVNEKIGAFRVLSRQYERTPQWCTYRGTLGKFTMTDCLIVRPGKDE